MSCSTGGRRWKENDGKEGSKGKAAVVGPGCVGTLPAACWGVTSAGDCKRLEELGVTGAEVKGKVTGRGFRKVEVTGEKDWGCVGLGAPCAEGRGRRRPNGKRGTFSGEAES